MEGKFAFQNRLGKPVIVGRKFTGFALFYFVFEGNFQLQAPRRLIFGGAIQRGLFCDTSLGGLYLEGLIQGGAYFRNFTVSEFLSFFGPWGQIICFGLRKKAGENKLKYG